MIDSPFRAIDTAFCNLMCRLAAENNENISAPAQQLIKRLSLSLSQQHSCLDITGADKKLLAELEKLSVVGDGSCNTPLVLSNNKLFLHRYYQYEKNIAQALIARNRKLELPANTGKLIEQYFLSEGANPSQNARSGTVDWQQIAALQCISQQLTIITGGPGTGKTSTVVKILGILMAINLDLVIKLAAPTGKAAKRLSDAINASRNELPGATAELIPTHVQTIHRLLGMRPDGRSYRHHQENPIVADILVIDEVSMVDLAMMNRLLQAIDSSTRLILLGDPEQLPSVEVGNVLADLCREPAGYSADFAVLTKSELQQDLPVSNKPHQLRNALCQFQRNYRFTADRGIGQLASDVRAGVTHLASSADDDVQVLPLSALSPDNLSKELTSYYFEYELLLTATDIEPETLLTQFESTRVLCPMKEGPLGIEALNKEIERHLQTKGIKEASQTFYHGRPIMITRNDYKLGLYNGDVGICVRDPKDHQLKVMFRNSADDLHTYLPTGLPDHETCFAMTVHKAQGSEFDHVTLIVPEPGSTTAEQLFTRELIYTAITRARQSVAIYTEEPVWASSINRTTYRMSNLSSWFQSDTVNDKQIELF